MERAAMSSPEKEEKSKSIIEPIGGVELLISWLLRVGVVTSLSLLVLGLLLMFIHHPSYLFSVMDLQRLTSPGAAFPHTLPEVVNGLLAGRGQAVVAVGLLMLIVTPIMRVAVSIVAFALQRDRAFVLITSGVLIILIISFVLGKIA
jgi:uncharacterized membrane protein